MPDRRTQLLDAALAVVADKGMKGLTHRAVDAAAEVAEGTTSNYFRSRAALVEAALDRLEHLDGQLLRDQAAHQPEMPGSHRFRPVQRKGQPGAGQARVLAGQRQQHGS